MQLCLWFWTLLSLIAALSISVACGGEPSPTSQPVAEATAVHREPSITLQKQPTASPTAKATAIPAVASGATRIPTSVQRSDFVAILPPTTATAAAEQPAKPAAVKGDKTRSLLQDMKKDLLALKEMLEKK